MLKGCETGSAKLTSGHNLPARFMIHTVDPIRRGGDDSGVELLASCYRNALDCASSVEAETVAFPSISTGAYGFPAESAAVIATETISEALEHAQIMRLHFVCLPARTAKPLRRAIQRSGRRTCL